MATDTPELFYESWLDALRDDVRALGGSKAVGPVFWPEKDPITASNRLRDCLNAEKRDRLTDEQERWIIREAKRKRGFSAALYHLCDDTEFERPKAKDPEDERAKLQRDYIEAVRTLERITRKQEAMAQQPLVRAVR